MAFDIEGEARPGRWLVTCDHATNRVPDWVNGGDLGLPAGDMARHIAFDPGAAGLARALGLSRPKAHYHLKQLEAVGIARLHSEAL